MRCTLTPESAAGRAAEEAETRFSAPKDEERTWFLIGAVTKLEPVFSLAGSSKHGAGKAGFEHTLPVPLGPPPPTRLRVEPEEELAAAIWACCLASTSLPEVT